MVMISPTAATRTSQARVNMDDLKPYVLSYDPGGDTPYDSLYGEAPPVRGTFFRLQPYKRVGISLFEVYEKVGKFVIWISKRAQRG